MDASDPRIVIYEFLRDLPDTIRTEELLKVCMYCTDKTDIQKPEEFINIVHDFLMRPGLSSAGAILGARAVIDYNFVDLHINLDKAEKTLKYLVATNPDFPDAGLLAFPMRKRHYFAANDQWKKLRAGPLPDRSIRYFLDIRSNPLMGEGT
ncbi:hypothetical protein IM876_09430 [Serratia plymuthica]|uniref:hypothetical protein n=1 Tax=Serratia plymuthica TaxID=82996 RepID=UPI0019251BD8|nr:hypothetical protein [Serratia plymuthica]MBL3522884.1 hypothetical protein [Serratia plymuthica]